MSIRCDEEREREREKKQFIFSLYYFFGQFFLLSRFLSTFDSIHSPLHKHIHKYTHRKKPYTLIQSFFFSGRKKSEKKKPEFDVFLIRMHITLPKRSKKMNE